MQHKRLWCLGYFLSLSNANFHHIKCSKFLLHRFQACSISLESLLIEICFLAGVPTSKGRHEILKYLLCSMRHSLREGEVLELAAGTHGFVGADLSSLCHEAALAALRRSIQLKPDLSASLSTFASPTKFESNSSMITSSNENENDEVSPTRVNPSVSGISSLFTALESVQLDSEVSQGPEELDKIRQATLSVNLDDFEVAKTRVRPSAMREVRSYSTRRRSFRSVKVPFFSGSLLDLRWLEL